MKAGDINKISVIADEITFIESVSNDAGFSEANLLNDNTLRVWQVTNGTVTLDLVWSTGFTAEFILLCNILFQTSVTIKTYSTYPTTVIETKVITLSDLYGFEQNYALFELTNKTTNIVAIRLEFAGASSLFKTYCGFIWAGDWINFGCAEDLAPSDESADQFTITRTNRPDTNVEFKFQSYAVTLPKQEGFTNLRSKIRSLWLDGFSSPRPFLIDEPVFNIHEAFLGIFDAPRVAYDKFQLTEKDSFLFQSTIGIREVF